MAKSPRKVTRAQKPAIYWHLAPWFHLLTGNNALHLKRHFELTLTDVSPRMPALGRKINSECRHVAGGMRALRLRRTFDFVFVHDAIMYMTSERDLARAIHAAFVHCKPGGAALFQPDCVGETYKPSRERGGHSDGARSLRYVETTFRRASGATAVDVEFRLTLKDRRGERSLVDRHQFGVFERATWLDLLRVAGFHARRVVDPWKRECFIARRAQRA